MSSRTLRRLRGDHLPPEIPHGENSEDDSDDEGSSSEEEVETRKNVFCFAESSSEEEDSSSSEEEDGDDGEEEDGVEGDVKSKTLLSDVKGGDVNRISDKGDSEDDDEEKDIDHVIAEFMEKNGEIAPSSNNGVDLETNGNFILAGIDIKTLDLDYSLKNILGVGGQMNFNHEADDGEEQRGGRQQRGRRAAARQHHQRQRKGVDSRKLYFGKARQNWIRPPSYVGGGMGMEVLEDSSCIPSIYVDHSDYKMAQWHKFVHSDTYATTEAEFERVANLGDVNMLAMFVAQNPLCASALLQFAMVLVHTGNMEQGTELLRRAVFVYEFACTSSFFVNLSSTITTRNQVLMDSNINENEGFFSATFRLMQISCMVGCIETSLSIARFILSLDPLRDPMGVLLTIDYFALATVNDSNTNFFIKLVESKALKIYHDDCDPAELSDLPNISFNYALALHRLAIKEEELGNESHNERHVKANNALKIALSLYPEALTGLLEANKVDFRSGRSFQTDWPSIYPDFQTLRSEEKTDSSTFNTVSHLINIFVQRSHKLWSSDEVLGWLYHVCHDMANADEVITSKGHYPSALGRYARSDPSDYEDRFKTLPAEANPLDPALVAPALAIDPNRRLLRRNQAMNNAIGANADELEMQRMLLEQMQQGRTIIDPDSPMLEVFLHSLMPWAQVDGVHHPRRPVP